MKNTVFARVMAMLLCVVMLVGVIPVHSHAEEAAGLTDSEKSAVLTRSMGNWIFPVAQEYYDVVDFCGCRGYSENVLYGVSSGSCISGSHETSEFGNDGLDIQVPGGVDIFAPTDGWMYLSGSTAVVEQSQPNGYSYYIILSNVTGASIPSGTYVSSGDVIAYSSGAALHFCAVMAPSGKVDQIAANPQWELSQIAAYGWLTQSEGTGMICVNPSAYTQGAGSSGVEPGPITYSFRSAPAVVPTEPPTQDYTEPPTQEYTEPAHVHSFDQQVALDEYFVSYATCQSPALYNYSCVCGERGTDVFAYGGTADHEWDGGVITVQPTHSAPGQRTFTCKLCGVAYTEEVAADASHVYDQQVASDAYLVSPANCLNPAVYRYSCVCGEAGLDTFAYGTTTDHEWDGGVITTQPTHTQPGVRTYTCKFCGTTWTESVEADGGHVYDQQVPADAYLASPATCASPALYYTSCTCGEHGNDTFAYGSPSSEHSWDAGVVTREASHTNDGEKLYTCSVCGSTRTESIPANASQHVYDQKVATDRYLAKNATCTSGPMYYYSCTCGAAGADLFEEGQPTGHTFATTYSKDDVHHWFAATCEHTGEVSGFGEHTWDAGVITVQPGHAVNGEKTYTCTVCGQTRKETVIGESHSYDQEKVDTKYLKTPATCDSPAVYFKSCICGEMGTGTFTSGGAKGHTFATTYSHNAKQHWQDATCGHKLQQNVGDHIWNSKITIQPTTTSQGQRVNTCIVCGETNTEILQPTGHTHTFDITKWTGNDSYHWHAATCEHTAEKSDVGLHVWDAGVVTVQPTHTTKGEKIYTCKVCGGWMRETITQAHVYDQQVASPAYLRTNATCTSGATYYKSCTCGAKGNDFFTYGNAQGHNFTGTWSKDDSYHWHSCSVCGTKSEITSHYYGSGDTCITCGQPRKDGHYHRPTKVPGKAATCTQEGNSAYYICECGKWFTDVTATVEIKDHNSVVIPAAGHLDKDNNGKCDICKERLNTETQAYLMTEGSDATWINTSQQGIVFRSSSEFAKFDHVEVDGTVVSSLNYTVSSGSTIVELNVNYLKRLTVGQHKIAIVAADGRAEANFSVKQGSASAQRQGSPVWIIVAVIAVLALVGAAVIAGYLLYTRSASSGNKGGKFSR